MSDPGAYEVLNPADFGVQRTIEVGDDRKMGRFAQRLKQNK